MNANQKFTCELCGWNNFAFVMIWIQCFSFFLVCYFFLDMDGSEVLVQVMNQVAVRPLLKNAYLHLWRPFICDGHLPNVSCGLHL